MGSRPDRRRTPARRPRTRRPSTTSASSTRAPARCRSRSSTKPGIPQVSPANTYVGLTTNEPGSAPGEPQKYYPTGNRTYLRIVPSDTIQAASDLLGDEAGRLHEGRRGQRQGGLRRRARHAARDSRRPATASHRQRHRHRPDRAELPLATRPRSRARERTASSSPGSCPTARCRSPRTSTAALPTAKVYGGDGVCTDSYTSAEEGRRAGRRGIAASRCTVATLGLERLPGGKEFLDRVSRPSTASNSPTHTRSTATR